MRLCGRIIDLALSYERQLISDHSRKKYFTLNNLLKSENYQMTDQQLSLVEATQLPISCCAFLKHTAE